MTVVAINSLGDAEVEGGDHLPRRVGCGSQRTDCEWFQAAWVDLGGGLVKESRPPVRVVERVKCGGIIASNRQGSQGEGEACVGSGSVVVQMFEDLPEVH